MATRALFGGLVIDQDGNPVGVTQIGEEAFYVIDDAGFKRHVDSKLVDRQVLEVLKGSIQGQEKEITEGTMRMLGQEDIFTKAAIEQSLRNAEAQWEALMEKGLPEEARTWLGMVGFRVVIDVHGYVVRVDQPAGPEEPPE